MKYNKGDCFKRMEEITDGWNTLNKTQTIMIDDPMDKYYVIYSDEGYHCGMTEEEIDKYFYRLHTREEIVDMLEQLNNLP